VSGQRALRHARALAPREVLEGARRGRPRGQGGAQPLDALDRPERAHALAREGARCVLLVERIDGAAARPAAHRLGQPLHLAV
jgi:hypothetical protein